MERSHIDDLSDTVSVLSQDRMSDDTDFLIGHNISFSNMNDSYIDAKSSSTTDIIYQQELNDPEVLFTMSKTNGDIGLVQKIADERPFTTGNNIRNYPDKPKETYVNSKIVGNGKQADFSARHKIDNGGAENIDSIDKRKEISHYSDTEDTVLNGGKRIAQSSPSEMSKSVGDKKSYEESSIDAVSSTWTYRSTHNSSEEELSFGKDASTKIPGTLSDSFPGNLENYI